MALHGVGYLAELRDALALARALGPSRCSKARHRGTVCPSPSRTSQSLSPLASHRIYHAASAAREVPRGALEATSGRRLDAREPGREEWCEAV